MEAVYQLVNSAEEEKITYFISLDLDAKTIKILSVEPEHLILNPGCTIYCAALGELVNLSVSHFHIVKGEQ